MWCDLSSLTLHFQYHPKLQWLDRGLWKHNKTPPSFSLILFHSQTTAKGHLTISIGERHAYIGRFQMFGVFFHVSVVKRIYLLFLTFRTESSVSFRYRDTLDITEVERDLSPSPSPVCYSNLRKTWPYPVLGNLSKSEVVSRQKIAASPHMSVIIQGKIVHIYVIKNVHRTLY